MRGLAFLAAAGLALVVPATAQARWVEASSENFVVYADDSEANIRTFSEQLERFHRAMEIVTGFDAPVPSASNRVTVFVVKNVRRVQDLAGKGSRNVAGFYVPRAGGSVAFVPRVEVKAGDVDFSMLVLLHEYAHHFMISGSPFPTPRWLNEGSAEFFASAKLERDGTVVVGMPANHRAGELSFGRDVQAGELLDPDRYDAGRRGGYDAFYGKSWLLYHYLAFDTERAGQLSQYMAGLMAGKNSREAAEQAFGAFGKLESDLESYLRRRTMSSLRLKAEHLGQPAIALRLLTEGEEKMMPVRLRSRRGVSREQAIELLGDARAVAARYPEDPAVLAALAEAEFDAGNDTEAIAAADAALTLDPGQVNAYVQKGYALFRRAQEADDPEAAYREAVRPFVALNRREVDHPLPLIFFYRSFAERGATPTELAVDGLERAAELAPFDLSLRFELAFQQAFEGRVEAARANLVPIAYNPHGGAFAEHARKIMERLDGGPLAAEEVDDLFSQPPEADAAEDAVQTMGR